MTYGYSEGVLTIPTLQEIIDRRTSEKIEIYGADINLNSDTPDGQDLNIQAQAEADMAEVLQDTLNGLNIDTATGNDLDKIAALKLLQRKGGSYTILPILLVADRDITLNNSFRISDQQGNTYHLETQAVLTTGNNTLNFVSDAIGNINPPTNTINTIISVTLGVVSVNNPFAPLGIGTDEEDDETLRNRFKESSIIGGKGGVDNIRTAILNIQGVVSCSIDSNRTNVTNAIGTPAHYNWIVANGGKDEDVATAIYETINDGVGMKGGVVVGIETEQGTIENIAFDRPEAENIYISFTAAARDTGTTIDTAALKQYLVKNFKGNINDAIDNNYIIDLLIHYQNNIYLYSNVLVGKTSTTDQVLVKNTAFNNYFALSDDNITITTA